MQIQKRTQKNDSRPTSKLVTALLGGADKEVAALSHPVEEHVMTPLLEEIVSESRGFFNYTWRSEAPVTAGISARGTPPNVLFKKIFHVYQRNLFT
jgi:hypothetical protein